MPTDQPSPKADPLASLRAALTAEPTLDDAISAAAANAEAELIERAKEEVAIGNAALLFELTCAAMSKTLGLTPPQVARAMIQGAALLIATTCPGHELAATAKDAVRFMEGALGALAGEGAQVRAATMDAAREYVDFLTIIDGLSEKCFQIDPEKQARAVRAAAEVLRRGEADGQQFI